MPFITLCRHFYVTMSTKDWVSFSLHHGLVEICDGLRTSINYWKDDIFFVHASTFHGLWCIVLLLIRIVDPSPRLILEEKSVVERLLEKFVKWTNPKEIMLGIG